MIPGICRASEIPSGASHSHSMHSSPHETVLTMLIIFAYNDVDVLPDRVEVYYLFVLIGNQFNSCPFFELASGIHHVNNQQ